MIITLAANIVKCKLENTFHTYQVFKVKFNFKNWLYNQANIRQDIFFKVYTFFSLLKKFWVKINGRFIEKLISDKSSKPHTNCVLEFSFNKLPAKTVIICV